jgi:maleate isomerase
VISIGVVTPHAAVGPEEELPAMAPGITIRVVRVPVEVARAGTAGAPPTSPVGLRALTATPVVEEAVEHVLAWAVDAIAYASTSSAYAIGFDAEVAMLARLAGRTGLPVVGTCASAVRALRLLDAGRVALVHPPWFDEELNELGASYFRSQGFEVVIAASAELASDPGQIEPAGLVEWGSRHVPDDAEAVFIGGNGFRAAAAIDPLERRTGRTVLESNQLLLWEILAQTGSTLAIRGFGRLFGQERRSPEF